MYWIPLLFLGNVLTAAWFIFLAKDSVLLQIGNVIQIAGEVYAVYLFLQTSDERYLWVGLAAMGIGIIFYALSFIRGERVWDSVRATVNK